MTEFDYQCLLDDVQQAIDAADASAIDRPVARPHAANDNSAEWALVPFPQGWQASP